MRSTIQWPQIVLVPVNAAVGGREMIEAVSQQCLDVVAAAEEALRQTQFSGNNKKIKKTTNEYEQKTMDS